MENTSLKQAYMSLILKKNNLIKEGNGIYLQYITHFGDAFIERYEVTMEIVKLRKMIAFCIRKQNYGEEIKASELDSYIELEMIAYEAELSSMIQEREATKNLSTISLFELKNNKKLYYEIAKKLHPDLHPDASPEEIELFQRATAAYNDNNTEELKRIYDIVLLLEDSDAEIPDLEEKIEQIKKEIEELEKSEPYILKYEYTPQERIYENLEAIQSEIDAARVVLEELRKQYELFTIVSEVM